jgi:hypothetical protein
MNKNEMARRKRQMNRRIREIVAIRRASLSLDAPAPVSTSPMSTPAVSTPAVSTPDAAVVPIHVQQTRIVPYAQITPAPRLKPTIAAAAMATRTKSQAAPVCP